MAITVGSTTTLAPVGNVDVTDLSQVIACPAGLSEGQLLVVVAFFAQALGTTNVIVPDNMTQINTTGTSTNR